MAFLPTLLRGIGGPNSLGQVRYKPNPDGTVSTLNPPERNGGSSDRRLGYQASPPAVDSFLNSSKDYPYTSIEEAIHRISESHIQTLSKLSPITKLDSP